MRGKVKGAGTAARGGITAAATVIIAGITAMGEVKAKNVIKITAAAARQGSAALTAPTAGRRLTFCAAILGIGEVTGPLIGLIEKGIPARLIKREARVTKGILTTAAAANFGSTLTTTGAISIGGSVNLAAVNFKKLGRIAAPSLTASKPSAEGAAALREGTFPISC